MGSVTLLADSSCGKWLFRVRGTITVQPSFDAALDSITQFFARLKADPPAGSLPAPLPQPDLPSSSAQPQSKAQQKRGKAAPATTPMYGLVTASQPTLISAWAQPQLDGHRQQLQMQPSSKRQQWQTAMSAAASAAAAGRLGQGSVGPAPGGLVPLGKAFTGSGPSPGQSLPMLPSPMPDAIVSVNRTATPSTVPSMLPYQQQHAEVPMRTASPQVNAARGHQLPVPASASHSGTQPGSRRQSQAQHTLSSAGQQQQGDVWGEQHAPGLAHVQMQGQKADNHCAAAAVQQTGHQQPHDSVMPNRASGPSNDPCRQQHAQQQHQPAQRLHPARQAQHAQQVLHVQQPQEVLQAQHAQQAQRAQPAAACGVSTAILQEWVTADMQAFVVWVSTHDFMQVSASLNRFSVADSGLATTCSHHCTCSSLNQLTSNLNQYLLGPPMWMGLLNHIAVHIFFFLSLPLCKQYTMGLLNHVIVHISFFIGFPHCNKHMMGLLNHVVHISFCLHTIMNTRRD